MNHNRKFNNARIFENIDTEEKAYWLGFLAADGYVSSGEKDYKIELALSGKDKGHIEKFKEFIGLNNKIQYRALKGGYEAYRYGFRNKLLKQDLTKNGCPPQKSLILEFPTETQVPNHLIHHYMRGYFDGDGWITYTGTTRQVGVIGTEKFLSKMKEVFNLPDNKLHDVHGGPQRRYLFSGQASKEFISTLYKDATIYLDRKYLAYNNYISDMPFRQRNLTE